MLEARLLEMAARLEEVEPRAIASGLVGARGIKDLAGTGPGMAAR
ncbi:MAG: hypothetical protein R3D03_12275 [Geminicoccaceae bacterium]